jgi:protein-tyrosine kinase
MSRIHEALKKAGLETTTVSPPSEVRLPAKQTVVSPEDHLVNLAQISLPRPAEVPRGAPLRFVDIKESCVRADWHPDPLMNVFANPPQNGQAAEQFRTLRSRLYSLQTEKSLRVVLITSPLSADGKTFTASNLAQAIVRQPDRHVLLIDADLRSSRLHVPLGASAEPGLGEYLNGAADEMSVIQHGQEGGLYFIAGGKTVSNASELLSNGRFKNLLERTAPCFDWIIIDSPPCVPVADASMIAGLCDGVVLVVRAGLTPLSAAHKACQELQKKKKLVGVVLNAVDERTLTYSTYYGRGTYGQVTSDDSTLRLQST